MLNNKTIKWITFGGLTVAALYIFAFTLHLAGFSRAPSQSAQENSSEWLNTEEWAILETIIKEHQSIIDDVAYKTDVDPKLLAALIVPEQLRLFHSNRELFKSFFKPLQKLGIQTQFSWGILGIKEQTALEIENNLKDKNSIFYVGKKYENMLDYDNDATGSERFKRLASDDPYYSLLYAALFIKQIEAEWQKADFGEALTPDIIATLWNIGFTHSKPKKEPKTGGAIIEIAGKKYTFGEIVGHYMQYVNM